MAKDKKFKFELGDKVVIQDGTGNQGIVVGRTDSLDSKDCFHVEISCYGQAWSGTARLLKAAKEEKAEKTAKVTTAVKAPKTEKKVKAVKVPAKKKVAAAPADDKEVIKAPAKKVRLKKKVHAKKKVA